jgi:hypothetical protein
MSCCPPAKRSHEVAKSKHLAGVCVTALINRRCRSSYQILRRRRKRLLRMTIPLTVLPHTAFAGQCGGYNECPRLDPSVAYAPSRMTVGAG